VLFGEDANQLGGKNSSGRSVSPTCLCCLVLFGEDANQLGGKDS